MSNWWNQRINQYMGSGYGDKDWESWYGKNPYIAGQDYPLGDWYKAHHKQFEFGNPNYQPPALGQAWKWGDPKLGVHTPYAPTGAKFPGAGNWKQEQQTRGMSSMLGNEYDWLLGNQKGNISDDWIRQIMPPQIGIDQARTVRSPRPSVDRITPYDQFKVSHPMGQQGSYEEKKQRNYDTYLAKIKQQQDSQDAWDRDISPLEELNLLGYFPTQGYAFNPAMGSLGGVGPNDYKYGLGPDFVPEPRVGPFGGGSDGGGAIATYGNKSIRGKRTTPGAKDKVGITIENEEDSSGETGESSWDARRQAWEDAGSPGAPYYGPGGRLPGVHDPDSMFSDWDMMNRDGPGTSLRNQFQEWDSEYRNPTTVEESTPDFMNPMKAKLPQEAPPTAGALHNLSYLDSVPGQLMNQYATMANQGIYGIPGLQTVFNAGINPALKDMEQRTPQILNAIRQSEASQRSAGARGLAGSAPSRISSQPGTLAKAMGEQVTAPSLGRQAGITSDLLTHMGDKSDALKVQRGEYVAENMRSKERGLAGMGTTANLMGNLVGSRYWDTSMRNKYGWTPYESGWVNAELQHLGHQYDMDKLKVQQEFARWMFEQEMDLAERQQWFDLFSEIGSSAISVAPFI